MTLEHKAACQPVVFHHEGLPVEYCADPTLAEQPLFERARHGEAVARLWQAPQGFVVPGSYRRFDRLHAVSESFSSQGWPVWLRRSGGGLVPQGPGIINLSLAWKVNQSLGEAAESVYLLLCGLLQRTLSNLGVQSHFQAVSGSFCDGRYNLACTVGETVRKIAGTAQYWRPLPQGRGYIVLAHAVILLDADLSAIHRAANEFEAQLVSGRVYHADKTITLAQLRPGETALLSHFQQALREQLQNIG